MAEATRLFAFASTAEGFIGYPYSSDFTLSYDSGVGNPAGSLKARVYGRNKNGDSYWEWTGTWEDLNVPSGATVTHVRVNSGYTRCTEYNVGANSTVGPYDVRDSTGSTVIATLWSGRAVTGTEGSWSSIGAQANQAVGSSYQASNTSIRLRLFDTLRTANNAGAAVSTHDDQVEIVVTYTVSSTDNLTAADITTGVPELGTPTLGQTHVLLGSDTTAGVPVLQQPAIGQVHALLAAGITSGVPVLGAPTLSEAGAGVDNLQAADITAGTPVLGVPNLGQVHHLSGAGISAGVPTLANPALGQVHSLLAAGITTGAPVFGEPSISQTHSLLAAGITTASPILGNPVLGEIGPGVDPLMADNITAGVPVLGLPTLGQVHALQAAGIAAGVPVLGAPNVGQVHYLLGAGITTGVPILGRPTLFEVLPAMAPPQRVAVYGADTRILGIAADLRVSRILRHQVMIVDR